MSEFILKPLKKVPLGDYFSQTKKEKQSTKKFRLSRNKLQNYTGTNLEEENNSQKSKKEESEEEKLEREKYQMRYFELERKIQNDEHMSYLQHRRAEEEYVYEQEKLAETWMTCIKKKRQLMEEKGGEKKEKTSKLIGQRSEGRAWKNGASKYKKWSIRQGSFGKKMPGTQTQSPEISNLGDLGEEFCEKLMFVVKSENST